MDEYCIVPKHLMYNQKDEKPASHPAESKDVLSLRSLVSSIVKRPDINDWKKADMLRSTLERYLALTSEAKETNFAVSVPQEVSEMPPIQAPASLPKENYRRRVSFAPLVKRTKRARDSTAAAKKKVRQGPDVTVPGVPVPRPPLRESDLMDMTGPVLVTQTEPVDTGSLVRRKRKPVQQSDLMDTAESSALSQAEPVAPLEVLPLRNKRRLPEAVDKKLVPDKKRASSRKRAAPRIPNSNNKKNKSGGGLKHRWIVLN